jgi:hypothetical protein
MSKHDDLQIPESPPESSSGEQVPSKLASRLDIELEVQWQSQTPQVHGIADRKGSFGR